MRNYSEVVPSDVSEEENREVVISFGKTTDSAEKSSDQEDFGDDCSAVDHDFGF